MPRRTARTLMKFPIHFHVAISLVQKYDALHTAPERARASYRCLDFSIIYTARKSAAWNSFLFPLLETNCNCGYSKIGGYDLSLWVSDRGFLVHFNIWLEFSRNEYTWKHQTVILDLTWCPQQMALALYRKLREFIG